MNLLIELPGAKRSQSVLIVTFIVAAALRPFVDRFVSTRFINSRFTPAEVQPAPPGSTSWDFRSMWE
jgi:hypothetical protein